ncbi:hypothetical protein FUA48_11215 [Flavobacterium alkalisoli]|uniref:Uncharacterized protein n=1 Tax=Flavobacterium alkalisoli TaxID=2602769 RepID=A0A5B9FV16_9FLAO|nr:hypothetical protein [Flavobacterium alkalisoli]QEE50129.1 hypothetical protein FUA48_11215 [Flavobacterium alkalisoli]
MKNLLLLLLVVVAGCKSHSNSYIDSYGFALEKSKIRMPNGDIFRVIDNPKWDSKYAGKSVIIRGSYRTIRFVGEPGHLTQYYAKKVTVIDECADIEKIMIDPEFTKYFKLDIHFKKEIIEVNYPDKNFSHDLDCRFKLPSGRFIMFKKVEGDFEGNPKGEIMNQQLYVSRTEDNSYHFFMSETNLALTARVAKGKAIITSYGVY